MAPPGDSLPSASCPWRYKRMFMSSCLVTLLVWFFYSFSLTEFNVRRSSVQAQESWSNLTLLQTAIYKLQAPVQLPKTRRKRKTVLLWTDYFSTSNWLPSTSELQCPVSECDLTSNRSMLTRSSAVVLHWRNIDVNDLPECVPSDKVQCPLWVLFNKEAPPHTSKTILEKLQDKVHWTSTYRQDSDLFAPYGKVLPSLGHGFSESDYDPNRRLVCWLVSNCETPSRREDLVKELQLYTEVDIYGQCGTAHCPRPLVKDCYRWLSKRCKFYLSFENSICKDYITEKLYYALSSSMVPVVMGNTSNYQHLPPHSYISASDYSSPKELAEHLVTVGKDRRLYMSYLLWRKKYEVVDFSYKWFCDLCAKLHDTDIGKVRPRKNLTGWWYDQSECMS